MNLSPTNCSKKDCGCKNKTSKESPKNPENKPETIDENKKSPTRFGDWEVNGRAIDF